VNTPILPPAGEQTKAQYLHELDIASKHRPTRIPAPSSNRTYNPRSKQSFFQQHYGLRPNRMKNYSYKHRAAKQLLAQHLFQKPQVMHVYNKQGKRETVDSLIAGPDGKTWTRSLSNELG
jgi:hypothetical protein